MSRLPFEISVAQPCTQQWSEMSGSNARRHCQSCNKQVHNFAAMTPREIERLIVFSDGHVCGRISRDGNGHVITAPQLNRPSAAGLALAASLSIASAAGSQSTNPAKAIVTGVVQSANPKLPVGRAKVIITQGGMTKAIITTEPLGEWRAEVAPGVYDFHVFGGAYLTELKVDQVTLHSGEQSFGAMKVEEQDVTITVGDVATTKTSFLRTMGYRLRHPIQYIAYLSKRNS